MSAARAPRRRPGVTFLAGLAACLASRAAALSGGSDPLSLPPIEILASTPLPGPGIDIDKVPSAVQSLSPADLRREGAASIADALTDQAGGVNANAAMGDAFQPDILFHGFEASPVLGTPQGLAVYQNGVRVNEAFGDTVDWDLIPDLAIGRIDLASANPVYGLNALGGAVLVTMKNGFTYDGFEGEASGGSFGRRDGSFQYGKHAGAFGVYVAGKDFAEDGWRESSPDRLQQLYADFTARGDRGTASLDFTGDRNGLYGQGPAPEQELAVDRSAVFTGPQDDLDRLAFVALNGSYEATDRLSFQGSAYRREFSQTVDNGNTTDYKACVPANGYLCQSDGTTELAGPNGAPIPDLSDGGAVPIGENDREDIHAVGLGAALQTTFTGDVSGRGNHLVLGGSLDHASVDFQSSAEVGVIDPDLVVQPGYQVVTPESSGFNATPVGLRATDDDYSLFFTDTFDWTPALSVTASARENVAFISLADQNGSNLDGSSRYSRFNPALGAAYKVADGLTAYGGYSEGNRVPTPSELECSDPARPCLLPSSLSSDPPLKQVVSHAYEAGLRGSFGAPKAVPGAFTWNLGLFRTDLFDDIYGVATSISSGYFENIGSTRRQGLDARLGYDDDRWSAFGSYSLVDAAFESPLTLPSPNNPAADANGNIQVAAGDRLPGIPEHQFKVGVDFRVTDKWTLGAVLNYYSGQYLRGDESNQNAPLAGYAVVNLHGSYRVSKDFELFAGIMNLFNARYETFGQYGDPTGIGAPGIPAGAAANGPGVDNRFVSPAPPFSVSGGIRLKI